MEETCSERNTEEEKTEVMKNKGGTSLVPSLCPYQSSVNDTKESKREEPRLHTEGVSEFLTHYERIGYTEDSLRQFVVLDDISKESKGKKRKRDADDGEDEVDDEDDYSDDDEPDENNESSDSYYEETDHSDVPDDEIEKMLEEGMFYKVGLYSNLGKNRISK